MNSSIRSISKCVPRGIRKARAFCAGSEEGTSDVVPAFAAGELAPSPLRASRKWLLRRTLLFLSPLPEKRILLLPGKIFLPSLLLLNKLDGNSFCAKKNIILAVHVQFVVYDKGVRKLPMWYTNALAISLCGIQTRSQLPHTSEPC